MNQNVLNFSKQGLRFYSKYHKIKYDKQEEMVTMNAGLHFNHLSDEEIVSILDHVTVAYLMEPLRKQASKYIGEEYEDFVPSRGFVNDVYLKYIREEDPDLTLYLSDIVIDIINYFRLSELFKAIVVSDSKEKRLLLEEEIEKKHCPITVDMFLRLLQKKKPKKAVFYDQEAHQNEKEERQPDVLEELKKKDDTIQTLTQQLMSLQMENETLKDENRELLFQTEDESELDALKDELERTNEHLADAKHQLQLLVEEKQKLQEMVSHEDEQKKKMDDLLLELRDYKIKYISLQAEVDQMKYTMKNDNKKLKKLEHKQRSLFDDESDWMMAMHELTWYKKEMNLPGNVPLHKIWAHLNREEAKKLAYFLKNFDRMLKVEKSQQISQLKDILIVKEAILILLNQDPALQMRTNKG